MPSQGLKRPFSLKRRQEGGRAGPACAHRRRSRDRRREGPPRLPGKLTAITVALQGGSMAAAGRCDAYADACTVAELCVREQTNRTREASDSVLSLTEAGAGERKDLIYHPSTPPHRAHHHRFWQSFRQLQPHAMQCSSRERRQCLQIFFFVLHPHSSTAWCVARAMAALVLRRNTGRRKHMHEEEVERACFFT